jgi:rhodanese-related sulfurtransferase
LDEKAYEKAHISGSVNIPLERIEQDAAARLDGNRPIVLYCYDYL